MRSVKFSYVLAICALLVFKLVAAIGFDQLQEMVASNYNFSSWVGGTNGYDRRVQNWSLPDLTIQTNGLNCRGVMNKWNYEDRLHVFDLNCAQTIVEVDSVVCTNCSDTRQAIIRKLASYTSTIRWQRYTNQLGDVAFYYPFGTNINALIFSRNNIMISIHSNVDYISVTNVAHQIDADILSKSRRE